MNTQADLLYPCGCTRAYCSNHRPTWLGPGLEPRDTTEAVARENEIAGLHRERTKLARTLEDVHADLDTLRRELEAVTRERDELQARIANAIHMISTPLDRVDSEAHQQLLKSQRPWSFAERKALPADEHEKQMLEDGPGGGTARTFTGGARGGKTDRLNDPK